MLLIGNLRGILTFHRDLSSGFALGEMDTRVS
jgi:hypothetical protein